MRAPDSAAMPMGDASSGDAAADTALDGAAFIPRDAAPLSPEPCADSLQVTTVAWPDPALALGAQARLHGEGERFAAVWLRGSPPSPEEGMAWAAFSATTGAPMGSGALDLAGAMGAVPAAIGPRSDGWRIYFRISGGMSAPNFGWFDVDELGMTEPPTYSEQAISGWNEADVVGDSLVASVPSDARPATYLHVQAGAVGLHEISDPLAPAAHPVISPNERWAGFAGALRPPGWTVGRIDLVTGDVLVRDLVEDPALLDVRAVGIDDAGRMVVSTLPATPEGRYRFGYLWLDQELAVDASWVSASSFPTARTPHVAPVVAGLGGSQLLVFATSRNLYAGLATSPGTVVGASRPLLLLRSVPFRMEAWTAEPHAYVGVAAHELTLLRLSCEP